MHRVLTVSETSRNFSDVVNRSYYKGESTLVTRSGEAVAKIIPVATDTVLGGDLVGHWKSKPRLTAHEAKLFAEDIETARKAIDPPADPWAS